MSAQVGLPSNPRNGALKDNSIVRPPPRQRSLGSMNPNNAYAKTSEPVPPLPSHTPTGGVDDAVAGMQRVNLNDIPAGSTSAAQSKKLERNGTVNTIGGYGDIVDDYYGVEDNSRQDPYRQGQQFQQQQYQAQYLQRSQTQSQSQHPPQGYYDPQQGYQPQNQYFNHDPYSQQSQYPPQQQPYPQDPYDPNQQQDPYARPIPLRVTPTPQPQDPYAQQDPYYDPTQQFLSRDPYQQQRPQQQGYYGGDPYAQPQQQGYGDPYAADPYNQNQGWAPPPSQSDVGHGSGGGGLTSAALQAHTMTSGGSSYGGGGAPSISGRSMASQRRPVNFAPTERGGGMRDSQPITKDAIDDYRNRIKNDTDPETQFTFAKYLIEAAKQLSKNIKPGSDEKMLKKYRDSLLQESLKLIKRLATQGTGLGKPAFAEAQFFLANCLSHGTLGLQVDHEKAYNLYVQASKQNHPSATYRTAVCNELGAGTRRDPNRAVLFYRKASALGDTAGMYKLGIILLNGLLDQKPNLKDAVGWLKRAASQADEDTPHGLHELGLLFERRTDPALASSGIVQDEAQARELFTQAAQLGHAPSQNRLGQAYEYGNLTCPVDPRRSIAWYTRAAERGDKESELALSGWYLTGSDGVLKQSDTEAYLWARRAANKGLPKAEYAVGYYSEVGIGVKQDVEEAKKWYMRAAAQGNKRAMQRLTELKKIESQPKKKGQKQAQQQLSRPTRQQAENECVIS